MHEEEEEEEGKEKEKERVAGNGGWKSGRVHERCLKYGIIVFYFFMKEYTSVPLYRRHMCAVQVICVRYE